VVAVVVVVVVAAVVVVVDVVVDVGVVVVVVGSCGCFGGRVGGCSGGAFLHRPQFASCWIGNASYQSLTRSVSFPVFPCIWLFHAHCGFSIAFSAFCVGRRWFIWISYALLLVSLWFRTLTAFQAVTQTSASRAELCVEAHRPGPFSVPCNQACRKVFALLSPHCGSSF
jgi:hypothetical protein